MRRGRKKPRTHETGSLPAPVGGINAVDVGAALGPLDAVWAYNVLASAHGLAVRRGWKEWATNVAGAIGTDEIRAMLPFDGNAAAGAGDRLFAVHPEGIWNVTDSGTTPTKVASFGSHADASGFGNAVVMSTSAGRFLLYCDEENGLWIYSESSDTWAQATDGAAASWTAQTTYAAGNKVVNSGNQYTCTTGGESAASGGPTGTGSGISDGTCVWDYVAAATGQEIGPSLADQQLGYTFSVKNMAQVCVWKNRVWLVEKNTSRAWYLGTNAIYGEATSFDFGPKMLAGGPLRGLFNWTYDGGGGLDSHLVGVSGAGDVVIYQGTDPSSASTFGLKGCWSVGAVPAGRRLGIEYGGELLVLSLLGVVPLSQLVVGGQKETYATKKVSNLFADLAATRRNYPGWSLHIHPQENALVVIVPTAPGQKTEQLVMSFGTGGWFRWADLGGSSQQPPIYSACNWNGEFYFGTPDGRVCINQGYVDGVTLASPTDSWTDVEYAWLTAFNNLNRPTQKMVKFLMPMHLGGEINPVVSAVALYDFDLQIPSSPSASPAGGWDSEIWDTAVWDADFRPNLNAQGATGVGRYVAAAIRGKARSKTVIVSVDVVYEEGGIL